MTKRVGRVLTAAAIMLALAISCGAVDFTADTVTKMGKGTITGKVYRLGKNVRQETNAGGRKQIIIIRADKRVVYMVNPAAKTYMEMPQRPGTHADKPFDISRLKELGTTKSLGSEKVNGFMCEKTLLKPNAKAMGTSTYWVSKDLQWPIKMVSKRANGGMVMETKNIKLGPVPRALFTVPKGYKKQAMPKMPAGAMKGMKGMPARPHK